MVMRISDPMAYNSNILLGRITKVSGYEGAVTVKLEKIFFENIPQMESVFLEIEGRPVPFFISDSVYSGADILKLIFKDYNTSEKVMEFVGCRLYLTTDFVQEKKGDDIQNLQNFDVYNQDNGLLGKIVDVIKNPGQWLLIIHSPDKKELLVPLHEDFIISFDNEKKTIVMEIPEGLTEIN